MIYIRRFFSAGKLGFVFFGTTYTKFPAGIIMNGRKIILSTPGDGGYLKDLINILLDDEYGLSKIKNAPLTIVDIGANIGLSSLYARSLFSNAVIHSYEPNPDVIEFTRKNLLQSNVLVFQEGVSNTSCLAEIILDKESRQARVAACESGNIKLVSFRTVLERIGGHIDLLKIDCEGSEWEILSNAEDFKNVKLIRMEYHFVKGYNDAHLKKLLSALDFDIEGISPNNGFGIVWLKNKNQ